MNCDSPAELIACAIRNASEPGIFEYFAYLVIPGLVGLVTLAVAGASFAVARASLRLSETIVDEGKLTAKENLKHQLSERVFKYLTLRYSNRPSTIKQTSKEQVELEVLSIALVNSEIDGASEIQRLLWAADHVRAEHEGVDETRAVLERTFISGFTHATITSVIRTWFTAPDELAAKCGEAIALLTERIPKKAAKRAKKYLKEMQGKTSKTRTAATSTEVKPPPQRDEARTPPSPARDPLLPPE